MGSLLKVGLSRRLIVNARPYASQSPWYTENKPGPYPHTEEEKVKAAKKYGLLREEYEPFPDDGNGCGDYPMLESGPVGFKDPFYNWQSVYYRRLYNEPIHVDAIYHTADKTAIQPYNSTTRRAFLRLLFAFSIIAIPLIVFKDYTNHRRIMEKQYPGKGKMPHLEFTMEEEPLPGTEAYEKRKRRRIC